MGKTLLILFTLSLFSCKGSQNLSKEDKGITGDRGIIDTPTRDYLSYELETGRRICGALKKKRAFYDEMVASSNKKIRFHGQLQDCGASTIHNTANFLVKVTQPGVDYEYTADTRTKYLDEVITNESGYMEVMCDRLTNPGSDGKVSNTILLGGSTVKVNFLVERGYDQLQFIKKNGSELVSSEKIFIFTQPEQTIARYMGVEKDRVKYTLCSDKKTTSSIQQTWVDEYSTL